MKYIKIYESWEYENYFTRISKREFGNSIVKFTPIDLDKRDIKELSKLITIEVPMRSMIWYNTFNGYGPGGIGFGSSTRLNLYINDINYDFFIYKSTDEWYYAVLGKELFEFVRKYGRQDARIFILDEVGTPSYYKCDQLEGLIKLIENFKHFKLTGIKPK